MEFSRVLSLFFGISGIFLLIFSLTFFQPITGAVIGTGFMSKGIVILGILLVIIAVIIHRIKTN